MKSALLLAWLKVPLRALLVYLRLPPATGLICFLNSAHLQPSVQGPTGFPHSCSLAKTDELCHHNHPACTTSAQSQPFSSVSLCSCPCQGLLLCEKALTLPYCSVEGSSYSPHRLLNSFDEGNVSIIPATPGRSRLSSVIVKV